MSSMQDVRKRRPSAENHGIIEAQTAEIRAHSQSAAELLAAAELACQQLHGEECATIEERIGNAGDADRAGKVAEGGDVGSLRPAYMPCSNILQASADARLIQRNNDIWTLFSLYCGGMILLYLSTPVDAPSTFLWYNSHLLPLLFIGISALFLPETLPSRSQPYVCSALLVGAAGGVCQSMHRSHKYFDSHPLEFFLRVYFPLFISSILTAMCIAVGLMQGRHFWAYSRAAFLVVNTVRLAASITLRLCVVPMPDHYLPDGLPFIHSMVHCTLLIILTIALTPERRAQLASVMGSRVVLISLREISENVPRNQTDASGFTPNSGVLEMIDRLELERNKLRHQVDTIAAQNEREYRYLMNKHAQHHVCGTTDDMDTFKRDDLTCSAQSSSQQHQHADGYHMVESMDYSDC